MPTKSNSASANPPANMVTLPDGNDPHLCKPCYYPKSAARTQRILNTAKSETAKKLAAMPKQREFLMYNEKFNNPLKGTRDVNAGLGYIVGKALAEDHRCTKCKDGEGCFAQCVVEGCWEGACCSCKMKDQATSCSLYTSNTNSNDPPATYHGVGNAQDDMNIPSSLGNWPRNTSNSLATASAPTMAPTIAPGSMAPAPAPAPRRKAKRKAKAKVSEKGEAAAATRATLSAQSPHQQEIGWEDYENEDGSVMDVMAVICNFSVAARNARGGKPLMPPSL